MKKFLKKFISASILLLQLAVGAGLIIMSASTTQAAPQKPLSSDPGPIQDPSSNQGGASGSKQSAPAQNASYGDQNYSIGPTSNTPNKSGKPADQSAQSPAQTPASSSTGSKETGLTVKTPPLNPSGTTLVLPDSGNTTDQGQYLTQTFLPNLTRGFVTTAGALSFLFVVVSGIQILGSFGSEDDITKAKKTLTWALGGLLISILSYAIVQAIISINLKV